MNESLMSQVFAKENNIGVAVSGGVDSVVLLHEMCDWAKKHKKVVFALHVHHGLRKESDSEEVFVKNLANKLGAKFICRHVDVLKEKVFSKTTTEEAARKLRYAALEKMANENNIGHICLAHNQNDQAETLLLHLIRGSGLQGACAMQEISGMFVRPLLETSRIEIEAYAKKNELNHVEDASNADTEYSRNYIRHNVLPLLEKLQNGATSHLAKFAFKMQEVNSFVMQNVPKIQKNGKNEVVIPDFSLPNLLFAAYVHEACNCLGVYQDIEEKHIAAIRELAKKQTGAKIDLPHGLVAWKTATSVVITKSDRKLNNEVVDFEIGKLEVFGKYILIEKTIDVAYGNGDLYLDYFKIPDEAKFRTAKEGDRFTKLGAKGSKKLVDYFTDKKIPQHTRKNVVVLAVGSEILAVCGYDVSDKAKIDDQTEQVVRIRVEEK